LGWIFVFVTTEIRVILFGVGALLLGCITFLVWSKKISRWPFETKIAATPSGSVLTD
jgi:hypothetical protein